MQINYEVKRRNKYLKYSQDLCFIFDQALILMAFILEFTIPNSTALSLTSEECKGPTLIFMFIYLVLSVYQYLDVYVIIALIAICIPFILIFLVYHLIKKCHQK